MSDSGKKKIKKEKKVKKSKETKKQDHRQLSTNEAVYKMIIAIKVGNRIWQSLKYKHITIITHYPAVK